MARTPYLLIHGDGSREHISSALRTELLSTNQIKQIGPREFRDHGLVKEIRNSKLGPANVSEFRVKSRFHSHLRASRMAAIDGFHTPEQWLSRIVFYGWRCCYCGVELNEQTITKDHRIAVVNSGTDWPSNLVPACKPCNSWKGDRKVRVFGTA